MTFKVLSSPTHSMMFSNTCATAAATPVSGHCSVSPCPSAFCSVAGHQDTMLKLFMKLLGVLSSVPPRGRSPWSVPTWDRHSTVQTPHPIERAVGLACLMKTPSKPFPKLSAQGWDFPLGSDGLRREWRILQ